MHFHASSWDCMHLEAISHYFSMPAMGSAACTMRVTDPLKNCLGRVHTHVTLLYGPFVRVCMSMHLDIMSLPLCLQWAVLHAL